MNDNVLITGDAARETAKRILKTLLRDYGKAFRTQREHGTARDCGTGT